MKMKPKYLGKQHRTAIAADGLDLVKWSGGPIAVTLVATEFTSLCPVTGQPDFARVTVEYVPEHHIIETKSFKLYMWGYRGVAALNEEIVARIADDINRVARPVSVAVTGTFNTRGGVGVTVVARRKSYR